MFNTRMDAYCSKYSFESQCIGLNSIPNARELGGLVLPDGRRIRKGLLLRGGSLSCASDADIARLRDEFHVAKVFDFRTSMEVRHEPDREIPGAMNVWMPAFDEDRNAMAKTSLPQEAYSDLGHWLLANTSDPRVREVAASMYTELVASDFTQVQYAGFLQNIVATGSGAVYWHCSQGKDRTGLASALLLGALGADRELIMQDYAISAEFYAADLAPLLSLVPTDDDRAVLRTFISVNCPYFEKALDLIDSNWGSMDAFLRGPLCMSDADFDILKSRYLE